MGKIFKEIIAKELQISLITLMCTFKGAQWTLSEITSKRSISRHIVAKILKAKNDGIRLKAAKEQWLRYKGAPVRFSGDFSLHPKKWRPEGSGMTNSKFWKNKIPVNQESYAQQNSLSKMEAK